MRIKRIQEFLEKLPKPFLTVLGFLLVLAIGGLDFITGYDISVSFLYLLPIALIAWFEGGVPAALISIFSAVTWAVADLAAGHVYSHITVYIWNTTAVLGMFLIVAYSITAIKKLLIKEREHAHIDDLTGAEKVGFFYDQARIEIERSAIHKRPLTLAYLDIVDLTHVNEILGYSTGDYLLSAAAHTMRSALRSTDLISRIGGAEFAILLPETNHENAAVIIYKVREDLLELVKKNGWPVTFSAGVVTCEGTTCTINELIKQAKDLMKAAKESGKSIVKFKILDLSSMAS